MKLVFLSACFISCQAFANQLIDSVVSRLEYSPPPREYLTVQGPDQAAKFSGKQLRVTTLNIGYFGLGEHETFFSDEGEGVIPNRSDQLTGQEVITKQIEQSFKSGDNQVWMIQEVDTYSRRSAFDNQADFLHQRAGSGVWSSFAYNYKSWVPAPGPWPWGWMGRVEAGLMTISTLPISKATRIRLTNRTELTRIFYLKRCLLVTSIPMIDGRTLQLINIHLDTFDGDGAVRRRQTKELVATMLELHGGSNPVIVGGDWNQIFGGQTWGTDPRPFWAQDFQYPDNWPKGWLVHHGDQPTVRDLKTPLAGREDAVFKATIDGFCSSPNVKLLELKTEERKNGAFKYADHAAVTAVFQL